MLQARGAVAREGDVALVYRGYLTAMPLRLTRGAVLQLREGVFAHDDMIGQQYGRYVYGRVPGRVATTTTTTHDKNNNNDDDAASVSPSAAAVAASQPAILLLQNSADLWTQAVPHRTQIIYDTDMAVIVLQLRLRPGSVVAEAGTGSASLTHALARAVAPRGVVYTYDFHQARCRAARAELRANGLPARLVRCDWRDVCSTDTTAVDATTTHKRRRRRDHDDDDDSASDTDDEDNSNDSDDDLAQRTAPRCGFGLPASSVDAVFLDVPSPWLALDNVKHVLREDGVLCTFSPCIEQTQRTTAALRQPPYAFVDIRTVEALTHNMEAVHSTRAKQARSSSSATTTTDAQQQQQQRRVRVRRCSVGKGHSAYLTFARRRMMRDAAHDDDNTTTATTTTAPSEGAANGGGEGSCDDVRVSSV